MASKTSRGKRSKSINSPFDIAPAPANDRINIKAKTASIDVAAPHGNTVNTRQSSSNAHPQSPQADAASSQSSFQIPTPAMSPTSLSRSDTGTQYDEKYSPILLTTPALDVTSPRHAESPKQRTVPGKLGPERLKLRHNASGVRLKRDHLVPSSLTEMVKQPWEKGDSGGEGEKDVATGSKWVRTGSGEGENVEKARVRDEGRGIRLGILDMSTNDTEKGVYATKRSKAPLPIAHDQHTSSRALERVYSSLSSQASCSSPSSNPPPPSFRLLANDMSAFDYAIRPFLDNSPTSYDHNLALSSPTTASFISSEKSGLTDPFSAAHSSWSHRTEQLYEAPPPEQGLPKSLKGANKLENRLRYLTLKTALLRCAVLSRLTDTSHDAVVSPPSPVSSACDLRVHSTSRSRNRARRPACAGSRSHSRLRSHHSSHSTTSDSDSDGGVKTESYEAWLNIRALAFGIAYHVAHKLEHQGWEARCLYWMGRAEWGLGNWENAQEAFEKLRLYGADDLKGDEKDWEFWLKKVQGRDVVDDEDLGMDMNSDENGDGNEEPKQEEEQKKGFEEWEWEYITHGGLRKYKAAHRCKHRKIRERAIPDMMSPASRHLSPFSARSPYNRYQEQAFSPRDQTFGNRREISPPRENLQNILEQGGDDADTDADVEDFELESPANG